MITYLRDIDHALFLWFNHALANPLFDLILPWLNHGSHFLFLFISLLLLVAWRGKPTEWKWIWLPLLGVALSETILFNPLKEWIARPRPAAVLEGVRALVPGATGGHSFPSSHTANAFVAATLLAMLLPRLRVIWFAMAGLIGFSRIYVGVHFPSDVLGSAILGILSGWGISKGYQTFPIQQGNGASLFKLSGRMAPWGEELCSARAFLSILFILHLVRLLWCLSTPLDAPPDALHFLLLSKGLVATRSDILNQILSGWFGWMKLSSGTAWLISWFTQLLWMGVVGWLVSRETSPGIRLTWLGLVSVSPFPAFNLLMTSPAAAWADSDWEASLTIRSLILLSLLGAPLWIRAILGFRHHSLSSLSALLGFLWGIFQPDLPTWIPFLFATPLYLQLARYLTQGNTPIIRVCWISILMISIPTTLSVHQPRVLKKLGISMLPRNLPQYPQWGWEDWLKKVEPIIEQSRSPIWVESEATRMRVLLHFPEYQVEVRQGTHFPDLNTDSVWYIREVTFAQINPEVLFRPNLDWQIVLDHFQVEELHSSEYFLKGDPVRQIQLFQFKPKPETAGRGTPDGKTI